MRWWAVFLLLALAAGTRLAAATVTWTGAGSDNNWATAANWSGGAPNPGDALVFAGSTRPAPNNNTTAGTSYASITFSAGATAFTISGNAITLTGGITNSSSATQTLGVAIALSGTVTVTATTNPVVLNGVLSGSGALATAGANSVTVNASNTYTGGTTVSAGTLNAGGTALGTGLVTVSASGTLAAGAGGAGLFGQFVSATAVTTNFAALATLQAHFATKVPGLLTNPTTLNSGGGYAAPFASGTQNFEALFTGTLTIATAGNYTFNTTSDDGSMLFIDGAVVVNNNGAHASTLVTSSATALTAGAHTIAVGFFNATGGYALNAQISGAGNTTMADINTTNAALTPGHLDIGSLAGSGALSLAAGDLLVGRDNTNSTFSGVVSGAGALHKIGTGTLTLSGNNTYAGVTRIYAGGVQVGGGAAAGTLGPAAVFDNGTLTFARSDSVSVANQVSGSGGVVMNGSGTLTLTQPNTYTGTTTISQGTVNATGAELSTGAVTVAAGATLAVTGGSGLAARYFNVAATAANFNTLTLLQAHLSGQALALANTTTTANFATNGTGFPSPYTSSATNFEAVFTGRVTIGTAGTYTFNTGSDDGSVLFVDGTLVVNNNAFQGYTTKTGSIALTSGDHDLVLAFYQGTATYGLIAQISGAGNTTMVDLTTANATLKPDLVVGSLAGAGTVQLTDGGLVTGFDGTSTSFTGVISGPGGLVKRGAGTLTLGGASTYGDGTTVAGGTLKLASGASLGNTAITVCSGATLAPDPASTTMAFGTTGAGTLGSALTLGAGTVYDMTDGAVGTVALQQNASFATTPLAVSGATLNFNIGSAGPDTLAATLGATTSGTNSVGMTTVGASLTIGGSYPFITATSGLGGATWQFTGGGTVQHAQAGGTGYILTLSSSATAVTVAVSDGVDVWNGTTSTDWNTAANWSLGVVPTINHDVQIGNGSGTFKATPSLTAGNGTCQSITFLTSAATLGAGGGTLTLGAGGITASVAGSSIACPVALGASQTWTTTASPLTVGGVVSGAFTVTKAGGGALTLTGANTLSGGVTLSAGTLNLGNAAALGAAAATFTIAGGTLDNTTGGALTIANNNPGAWSGDFTFTGTNALNLGTGAIALGTALRTVTIAASTLTVPGALGGAGGGVGKAGAGTLTLSGANTFTGGVTLSAGTLNINSATALGAAAGTFAIAGGTIIDNTSGGALTLTANNPGTWSGDFTFTGTNALGLGSGAVALGAATRTITVTASTLTLGGAISGTGGVTKAGAGAMTLAGSNTFSGGVTLSTGLLNLASPAALGATAGTFTIAGGTTIDNTSGATLRLSTNNPQTWNGDFTFTGSASLNLGRGAVAMGGASRQVTVAASTLKIGGVIGGTGGLTKQGAGKLSLSGASTYGGGTAVLAGTLALSGTSYDGFGGNGSGWTFNGTGSVAVADTFTLTDNTTNVTRSAYQTTKVPLGPFTISYQYQAAGSKLADGVVCVLQNDGRGATALGGAGGSVGFTGVTPSVGLDFNLYATNTTGSKWLVNGALAPPYITTSPVNIASGDAIAVTLAYDGTTSLVETLTDATAGTTYTNTISVGNLTTALGAATAFVGFTGGSGGQTATQTVSNFSYTTSTITTANLPSTTALTIAAGATVDLGGAAQTVASLADTGGGGGTVTNGGIADSVLTVNGSASTTFSGALSDGGTNKVALTRSGTGSLTLAGSSTSTGATTVTGGTLVVTGSTANGSAVAVSSGGTLAGTGTVGGAVTLGATGVLAPGTGGTTIATLTTGALTGNATSVFSIDLDGGGPTSDRATTSGTVTCAGTLTVASAGNAAIGKVYSIVSAGAVTGTFSGLVNGAMTTQQGRTFQIAYTATTVTLTDVARPTTRVWDGGGADNNWTTAANWDFDLAPSAGDDLQFAGSTRLAPNDDYTAGTSFTSITFTSGAGNFTVGGNALTLTGGVAALASNATTGTMTINTALTFATAAPTISSAAGGTLAVGGAIADGGMTLTLAGAGSIADSGGIAGSGGAIKNGAGTCTMTAASTMTGKWVINGGLVSVANTNNFGTAPGAFTADYITLNGGGVVLNLTTSPNANRGFTLAAGGGSLAATPGNVWTVATVITGPGSLTVGTGGTGTINLAATQTFAGTLTVAAGTLQNGVANPVPDACAVTVAAGAVYDLNGFSDTIGSLAGAGNVTLAAATLTCGGDNTSTTYSGVMSGSGGALSKAGSGTLALATATSTYTGGTTVGAGTLQLGTGTVGTENAAALGTGTVTVATGGTLWFKPGSTGTTYNLANSFALAGGTIVNEDGINHLGTGGGATIAVGAAGGTLKAATTTKDLFLDGVLTGSGALAVAPLLNNGSPSGVWFNNDASTYSGTVTATSAATTDVYVLINTPNALQSATIALVSGGANPIVDIDTAGATTTIAGLSGSAGIVQPWVTSAGSYALTIATAATSTYGGVLRDNGAAALAVTKGGSGTLTLAGANTNTGATTVAAGALLVTGSTAAGSPVTVTSAATLGGTGTVAGTVALGAGGKLAPGLGGTAIGTLTTGALTANATATFSVDLDGTTPSSDRVSTSGTAACAGTLTVASATNAALGKVYTIASAGTVSGTFAGLVNGAKFTQQGRTFQIAYTATAVTLTDVARPTTRVWDGGGGDNNWTTAANWDFDLAPSAGDDLQFAGSTRTSPNNDFTAGTGFASITFNSGAAAFTIGGNAIALVGNVTNSSASTQALNAPLALSGTTTVTCGAPVALGGALSGAGGLAVGGTAALTLSGANTFSGGVNLGATRLNLNSTTALGAAAGTLTIAGGATIDNTSGGAIVLANDNPQTWNGDFTFAGSNALDCGFGAVAMGPATRQVTVSAATLTVGGAIGGAGGLVKKGAGALALSQTGTWAGGTDVLAGTLTFKARTTSGFGGNGSGWTLNGGATIASDVATLTDNGGNEGRTAILNARVPVGAFKAAFRYQAGGNKAADGAAFFLHTDGRGATALGSVGGALGYGGITPSVAVGLNLFSTNTVGTRFFTSGTVTVPFTSTSPVSLVSGHQIQVLLAYDGASALTETLTDLSTGDTYSTAFAAGNLATTLGAGTAFLGFGGGTGGSTATQTISNFTFSAGGSDALPATTALTIAAGATLDLAGCDQAVASLADNGGGGGTVTNGGGVDAVLAIGGGAATGFSGVIADGASAKTALSGTGSGTLTLTGANTYGGATTVSAGTLAVSGGGLTGTQSVITQSGGTASFANATLSMASSASGVFGVGYGATGTGTVTVGSGAALAIGSGGGRVFIGGGNTVAPFGTGVLTISAGSVTVGAAGAFPNDLVYLGGFGGAGTINLDGGTLTTPRGFSSGGTSTLHFNGGTLKASAANASLIAAALTTVDVRGGGAVIDTNGFALGIAHALAHSTVGGDAAVDGGLTKLGSGTLTLSVNSSFTGPVAVSAGTLAVAGTNNATGAIGTASAIAIANGATISVGGDNSFVGSSVSNTQTIQVAAGGTLTNTTGSTCHLSALVLAGGTVSATTANTQYGNWNFDRGVSTTGSGATSTISGGNAATTQSGGTVFTVAANDTLMISTALVHPTLGADTGFIAAGAGTVVLSGTNTSTAATTVNAGTVLVTGSTAAGSAVAVNSGGTLGGTGTAAGAINVANGGTLAPGTGGTTIGTLTTGAVTFHATSTCALDLDGSGPACDQVSTASTVTCAGALTVTSNANAALGKVYPIIAAGAVSGTFSGLANNATFSQGGRTYRIAYTATAVTLTDVAPVLTARQTLDTDGDGQIDRIRLTFDQAVNDDFSGLTVAVAGYTVTGYATGTTANDAQIDVLLAESGAGDTGATPAVRITANTSLACPAGSGLVQVEGSGTAAVDGAAPVLLAATWTDGGAGGVSAGDTVALTFSESVTVAAMTTADLGLPVASDTLSTTTIAGQSGATVSMTLAGSPRLTPGGAYSAAATGAGKPSGLFLASAAHLADAVGLHPATGSAGSALDLGPGTATVAIAWATGADPRSWALGALTVGTIANSLASAVDLTVRDVGDCNVDLSIASTATAPSSWGPAASAGANAYLMKAATSAAAAAAPADPASYALTLASSGQGLTSGLLSGATSAYALYFQAPTTITSGSATQQTIVISITAALAP